jgi:predicted lipoprotein with Yx(FWY)xxD motif
MTQRRIAPVVVTAAAIAAALWAPTAPAHRAAQSKAPVRTIVDAKLGTVMATPGRQAIYVWNAEPKNTIKCTGACAQAWPPVIVGKGVVVPMHVKGIMGDFGTVRRPDGRRQLTFGKRALYTYAHEKPGQVLCNDVNRWFAVKVHR